MRGRKDSKDNQIWKRILPALACGIIPFAMCVIRTAIDGQSIFDIYLPNSTWNDELLYYKLTEACVHYGYPQGYFGFNESHALVGGFAAWSPVLLFPWIMWGLLFGWNLLSPILCNIVIMMIAMFVFGVIMKPNWKQVACMAALYAAFPVMTRFTLSGMPEVNMYALLLVIVALMWELARRTAGIGNAAETMVGKTADDGSVVFSVNSSRKIYVRLAILYILITLLTLMRPYYILLFIGFIYFLSRLMSKRKAVICSACLVAPVVAGYGLISHYFSAPYLTDLFYTDWLTAYKDGVLAGLKYDVWKLLSSIKSVTMMMLMKASEGKLLAGSLYFLFLLCIVIWLVLVIGHERVNAPFIISLQMVILTICFLGADLMMYRLQEGGRHTIAFIFVTAMLIPFAFTKQKDTALEPFIVPTVAMAVLSIIVFIALGKLPYEFAIPYQTEARAAEIEALKAELDAAITLEPNGPDYENTIIWPIWEQVDGETVVFDCGMLYAVPAGMGINACDGGYMAAQIENLKCGYIATMKGSDVEKWLDKEERDVIGENQSLIIYKYN